MEKNQLIIKSEQDRATVATILFTNGYTVRRNTVKIKEGGKSVIVLEYWKEIERG